MTATQVIVTIDYVVATTVDFPPHLPHTVAGGMGVFAYRHLDSNLPLTFASLIVS